MSPRREPRALPCEVWGGCEAPAVRRFQHTTVFGEPVTLWACREHAKWWRERHPELTGGADTA